MSKVGENELVFVVQVRPLEAEAHRCKPDIGACLDLLFSGQKATDQRLHFETVRSVTYVLEQSVTRRSPLEIKY